MGVIALCWRSGQRALRRANDRQSVLSSAKSVTKLTLEPSMGRHTEDAENEFGAVQSLSLVALCTDENALAAEDSPPKQKRTDTFESIDGVANNRALIVTPFVLDVQPHTEQRSDPALKMLMSKAAPSKEKQKYLSAA